MDGNLELSEESPEILYNILSEICIICWHKSNKFCKIRRILCYLRFEITQFAKKLYCSIFYRFYRLVYSQRVSWDWIRKQTRCVESFTPYKCDICNFTHTILFFFTHIFIYSIYVQKRNVNSFNQKGRNAESVETIPQTTGYEDIV